MSQGKKRNRKEQPAIGSAPGLRPRAEEEAAAGKPKRQRLAAEPDLAKLVHELQGRQIQLELQNEELRAANAVLEQEITRRQAAETELNEKVLALESSSSVMLGREMRLIELKREVNQLCRKLNLPEPYAFV